MEVARNWRQIPERYRMEAKKCKKCGHVDFPGRLICPECKSKEFTVFNLPNKGKLISHTVIRIAPNGFTDLAPYVVGIIQLNNSIKIMAQITDCDPDQLKTGDELIAKFRKMNEDGKTGMIIYSYKFVPDIGV